MVSITSNGWRPVTPVAPCPICGKPDWCARSDDVTARCMRLNTNGNTIPSGWERIKESTDGGVVCRFKDFLPLPNTKKIECTYEYRDESGTVLFEVVRFNPKGFAQRHRNKSGKLVWSMRGVDRVLYRLPELLAADTNDWVFVCEGEKDSDRLVSLGLIATCNVGGAGKWRSEYSESLRGRKVTIIPDNDSPGRKHATQVAQSLEGVAALVKIVELPGLADKGDICDFIDAQGANCDVGDLLIGMSEEAAPYGTKETNIKTPTPGPVTIRIDDIIERKLEWLWPGVIPLGVLTAVGGDPGTGKSYCCLSVACNVTTGEPMPGTTLSTKPASVIYIAGEDSASCTIKPRLRGMGYTDNGKFHVFKGIQDGNGKLSHFRLDMDIGELEKAVQRIGDVKLIVIDTLDCYVGSMNTNSAEDTRRITTPLSELAERRGLAIIATRHLNKKSGDKAIHRFSGSVAWVGAARAGYVVAQKQDDPTDRYWAPIKLNDAVLPPTFRFKIGGDFQFRWGDACDVSIDDLLAPQGPSRPPKAIDEAAEWLTHFLSEGPVKASVVDAAVKVKGFNKRTLDRAKKKLGIGSKYLCIEGYERKQSCWVGANYATPPERVILS